MKLALDTSQNSGSLALGEAGKVIYSSYFNISITHSETLMPQVDHALKFCGLTPADLSAVLLTLGPGSFTGLRIGLATAKGIAFGLRVPLITFGTLQLCALQRYRCGRNILAVLDAKMKEVYAALYDEHLNELVAPRVCKPAEICSWNLESPYLVGSGTGIAGPLLRENDISFRETPEEPFQAGGLFTLEALYPQTSEYDFQALAKLEPLYLRESTAQIKKASD